MSERLFTVTEGSITDVFIADANKDGAAATPSLRTLGTGALQAAAGDHTHSGTTLADGDYGDVLVSGTGTVWTLDSGVVTAAAKTVLDDASTAAMLTTLGAQPLDADLTALAASPATAGLVERTGAATYTTRLIGAANPTDIPTLADADARYAPISDLDIGRQLALTAVCPI